MSCGNVKLVSANYILVLKRQSTFPFSPRPGNNRVNKYSWLVIYKDHKYNCSMYNVFRSDPKLARLSCIVNIINNTFVLTTDLELSICDRGNSWRNMTFIFVEGHHFTRHVKITDSMNISLTYWVYIVLEPLILPIMSEYRVLTKSMRVAMRCAYLGYPQWSTNLSYVIVRFRFVLSFSAWKWFTIIYVVPWKGHSKYYIENRKLIAVVTTVGLAKILYWP